MLKIAEVSLEFVSTLQCRFHYLPLRMYSGKAVQFMHDLINRLKFSTCSMTSKEQTT